MAVFEEAKRLWHVAPPTEDGLCREQSSKAWARHSSSFEGLLGSVSIDVSIRFNRLAVELRPEQYGRVAFVVSDGRSLAHSLAHKKNKKQECRRVCSLRHRVLWRLFQDNRENTVEQRSAGNLCYYAQARSVSFSLDRPTPLFPHRR